HALALPAPLSLRGHPGRPDRWRPVRLRAGDHPRDLPADRGSTDSGWCPRMAFRRDPDARHRSQAVSPWEFDLEGPRDPLVADHRPPGTVLGLPCRVARSAVIRPSRTQPLTTPRRSGPSPPGIAAAWSGIGRERTPARLRSPYLAR